MEKLEKLYEGKAKQLYATDDPEVLWVEYKNSATAGDGEKKEDFAGKGRLNNLITTVDLRSAQEAPGIDSHLVAREWARPPSWCKQGARCSRSRSCCVTPRPATSAPAWASRKASTLKEPVLEYFLKNDDLHDPFVNDDDLVALGVCTREDLAEIAPLARQHQRSPDRDLRQDRRQAGRFQDRDGPHLRRHAAARRRDHPGFLPSVGSARPLRQGRAPRQGPVPPRPGRHHPGLRRDRRAAWPNSPSPKASKSPSNALC